MIDEKKSTLVIEKFFDAIKSKKDYEIESTGLTYYQTLELIKQSVKLSINENPEKFEKLVSWILCASMFALNDIDYLDEIDLELKNAQ